MKEDVLEQIVDDYLKFSGYFTVHNVGFKPAVDDSEYEAAKDRVPSDVDVVGFHPRKAGLDRVVVVTCKSWQAGFDADYRLALLREGRKIAGRYAWQSFRELWIAKWARALRSRIHGLTGTDEFSYLIAVTSLRGDREAWSQEPRIADNLPGCTIGFLPLEAIWGTLLTELSQRPAASEVGRLVQLLKAAGLTAPAVVAPPSLPTPGSDASAVAEVEEGI